MTLKIESNETNAAIEALETLLKAKIRLQDAQVEAQPVLETVGLLFEPDPLDEDQKNVLGKGLKSLRKLLEAHTAYGDAVQQAEPAREFVNQLFGMGQPDRSPAHSKTNGKADSNPAEQKAPDHKAPDHNADSKPAEQKADHKAAEEAKAASSK